MPWHHIKASSGVGLSEQWILRMLNAPVCSLKRDKETQGWQASLLNRTGISCVVVQMPQQTLEQAQRSCEVQLIEMGCPSPDAATASA